MVYTGNGAGSNGVQPLAHLQSGEGGMGRKRRNKTDQ